MSDFFERNCQALAQFSENEPFLARLKNTEPETDFEIYETEDGGLGILYRNIPLSSPDGAITEAQTLCQTYCQPHEQGVHLLFGMGLGYTLAEISAAVKAYPKSAILVYEPFLPLLRFVLQNVDISPYCAHNKILFNDNPLEFYQLLLQNYMWEKSKLDFIVTPGYMPLISNDVTQIMEKVPKLIEGQQFSVQLYLTLNQHWIEHFLRLLPYWGQTLPFAQLEGRFAGKTAVIVGAGPSLDYAIPELAARQDDVVILAVGRALRPLMRAGIKPDFAIFLDYEGPGMQLENLPSSTENIHFILGPFAENKVFQVPSRLKFMTNLANYEVVNWADRALGTESKPIGVVGTVSYLGLQAAYTLGCTTLILCGLDLAFSKERQYASGSEHSELRIEDNHLIVTDTESFNGAKIPITEVPGQSGEMLLTTLDYQKFKEGFERFAEVSAHYNAERRLINASQGGAEIKGFENLSIAEALGRPAPIDKETPFADLKPPSNETAKTCYLKLAHAVQALLDKTETMQRLIRKDVELLSKMTTESQWEQYKQQHLMLLDQIKGIIKSDELINMVVSVPATRFNRAVNKNASTWAECLQNIKESTSFLEQCRDLLSGEFVSVLQDVSARLERQAETGISVTPATSNVQ